MNTERNERGQSVPLPLRATMLKLLRLPFIRSLRVENSRIPAAGRRYADFSDILHLLRIAPCSFHVALARSTEPKSARERCPNLFSSRRAAGRRGRGRSEP